jgi:hypothetical protein
MTSPEDDEPGASSPEPEASDAPREPDAPPGPCAAVETTEQVTVPAGGWFVSATGLQVRFDGASHDSYEDGTTDLLLSLSFSAHGEASRSWLPSAFAEPRWETMLGHCVRVREGSEARVVLDVAPLPAPNSTGAASALAPCPPSPSLPRLEDYALTADGGRYVVDVTRDPRTGEWMPTPLPRMPHHHASRLTFENLAAHAALATAGGETLRFTLELVSRHIEQVPGRHEWRAEYFARIDAVCNPSASS